MDIKKDILKYKAIGDQEKKDKELILDYLDKFDNIFTRENELIHFTTSTFILNKNRDKLLMIYHKIYDSWGWIGGHADGDKDLFGVIKKEIEEETGIKNIKPLVDGIFSMELLSVKGHFRRGIYIAPHVHISVDYLFVADEKGKLIIKEDENSGVKWISIDKVVSSSTEPHMQEVYKKLIEKLKTI